MNKTKLGIDVGGTNTKFGVINEELQIIDRAMITSNINQPNILKQNIKKVVNDFMVKHNITEIRVSTAGVVNAQGIIVAANIKEYIGFDWKKFIDEEFGEGLFKLSLNDANAFARRQKVISQQNDFVCLTIGTGVGVSIVNNGVVQLGNDNIAGEVGSLLWKNNTNIDKYFSATNLNHKLRKIIQKKEFNFKNLELYMDNLEIKNIIEEYTRELSKLICLIITLNNPSHIFIAGGLSYAPKFFLDLIIRSLKSNFPEHLSHSTIITYAKEKNDANILGLF